MDITKTIKRAPRWAWYTAGGVGLGAAAIKLWKGRDKPDDEVETVSGEVIGTPSAIGTGGTNPGVIVPPVIIPPASSDPNAGVGQLQDLYVGAVGNLMDMFGGAFSSVLQQNQEITGGLMNIVTDTQRTLLATAGSAPLPVAQNPTPVFAAPAAAPATVAPAQPQCPAAFPGGAPSMPHGCFRNWGDTVCRDNGRSGAARKAWTVRRSGHQHADGYIAVMGEDKIRDGC